MIHDPCALAANEIVDGIPGLQEALVIFVHYDYGTADGTPKLVWRMMTFRDFSGVAIGLDLKLCLKKLSLADKHQLDLSSQDPDIDRVLSARLPNFEGLILMGWREQESLLKTLVISTALPDEQELLLNGAMVIVNEFLHSFHQQAQVVEDQGKVLYVLVPWPGCNQNPWQ